MRVMNLTSLFAGSPRCVVQAGCAHMSVIKVLRKEYLVRVLAA